MVGVGKAKSARVLVSVLEERLQQRTCVLVSVLEKREAHVSVLVSVLGKREAHVF